MFFSVDLFILASSLVPSFCVVPSSHKVFSKLFLLLYCEFYLFNAKFIFTSCACFTLHKYQFRVKHEIIRHVLTQLVLEEILIFFFYITTLSVLPYSSKPYHKLLYEIQIRYVCVEYI